MSEHIAVGGVFWVPEKPDEHVRGEFTAEVGKQPEVSLVDRLVEDPRVIPIAGGRALTGSAEDSVAAFQPITLRGHLETGESVTLLNAQNYGGGFGNPRYVTDVVVFGAHVNGEDQLYSAVRFRMDHPYWLAHLAEGEPTVVEDDQSALSVERSEEGNLVYESSTPATLRQLEIRVVSGCLVLAHLALDRELVTRETYVRVDPHGPWLKVHGTGFCTRPKGAHPATLLPCKELTVDRFAKWIALNDRLDGLAWAVARPVKALRRCRRRWPPLM